MYKSQNMFKAEINVEEKFDRNTSFPPISQINEAGPLARLALI
jgi:hypothetical protein